MQQPTAFQARALALLVLVLWGSMALFMLGACKQRDQPQATPVSAVEQFLRWRIKENVHTAGVPTADELAAMAPYLSTELLELLQQAAARHRSTRPSKKERPFIEGDLFSSVSEGPTSFDARNAGAPEIISEHEHVVPVRFWSARQTPALNWTDRLKVVMENGRYVVADVEYQNHWSFGSDTSLVKVLKQDGAGSKPSRKLARLRKQ